MFLYHANKPIFRYNYLEDNFEDQIPGVFPIGWFSVVNPFDTKVALDGSNKVMEVSGLNTDSATEVQKKFKKTIEGVIECKIKIKDSRTRIAIHIPQVDREYNPYDDIIIVILENDVYVVGEDNIVESDIGATFWEQLFLVDDTSWAIDEESLEDSDPLFSLLVDIWHTFKIEFNAKETFLLYIDEELIGEFSYPKYQPEYFTSLYFCVFASQYNFKFYVDNVSIKIIVAEDPVHILNIISLVAILIIITVFYFLWKDNKKRVKSYKKRKIGTLIFLVFLMSFAISPALLFYDFSGSNYDPEFDFDIPSLSVVQERDILIEWGDNIFQYLPYYYQGTFYDDADPMFAYTTAKIEFSYIPDSSVGYEYTIDPPHTKFEEQQPFDETNFTATEGSYRDLDNLQVDDNAYGSWNYTGIGHYRASYSFEDEIDGTSGTDIGFVDTISNQDVNTDIVIISDFVNHKKVLKITDNNGAGYLLADHSIGSTEIDAEIEFWWAVSEITSTDGATFICYEGGTLLFGLYINGDDLHTYNPASDPIKDNFILVNTWFHVRIVLDDSANTFDCYIDGIDEGTFNYRNPSIVGINKIIVGSGLDDVINIYFDAIGYSWDNDYMLGWNREEWAFFGDYNSTYSFEDDLIGSVPSGWVDTSGDDCHATVINGLGGHKKVLEFYDNSIVNWAAVSDEFILVSNATFEWWWQFQSDDAWGEYFRFILYESDVARIDLSFNYQDIGKITVSDGIGGWTLIVSALPINQWYHIRIVLDDTANTFEFFLDSVSKGTFSYTDNSVAGIDKVRLNTRSTGAGLDYYHWIDAVDYSWSPGYSLGRNRLTENHDLLSHYPASYSFPFDTTGEAPDRWTDVSNTVVFDAWYGHRKVLQLNKSNGNPTIEKLFYTDITSGTVEFYFGSSDVSHLSHFRLNDGGTSPDIQINIKDEKIQYYDGIYNDICDAIDDNWYHIRIDFECTTGEYQGLAADTFYVYVDEVRYGPYPFNDPVDHIDRIYLTSNTAAVYYYYVDAIDLSWDPDYYTGRNLLYTRANLLGQYPGTYSFTNELVYTQDEEISFVDDIDAGGTAVIESSLGNHRKILNLTANAGGLRYITHDFVDQTTDQTVEWWFRLTSVAADTFYYIHFYDSSDALALRLYVQDNDIWRRNGGYNKILDAGVIVDTWHHIKLVWDLTTDTFDTYFDGVLIEDDGLFDNVVNNIAYVKFGGYHATNDVIIYMDAYGESWDDNYLIGDDYHYNNFLGSETFEGYDLTSDYDNYYGLEDDWLYNGNGHYRSTYSFTDELDGTTGERIGFVDSQTGNIASIISEEDGHKKVLYLQSIAGSYYNVENDFTIPQTSGTYEMWVKVVDASVPACYIYGIESLSVRIKIMINGNEWRYDSLAGTWTTICPAVSDTWHHIIIEFETGAGGYKGLAADTFNFYCDGVLYPDLTFDSAATNYLTSLQLVCEDGNGYDWYVDAIGYSWDNDYMIGWNREEYAFFGDYPAAYSFEDDLIGDDPAGFDMDEQAGDVSVVSGWLGHKKVVKILDTLVQDSGITDIFGDKEEGITEFWFGQNNTQVVTFNLYDSSTIGICLYMHGGYFKYFNSTDDIISTGIPFIANVWYHNRVDFDCATDTFDWYVNGVLILDDGQFRNNVVHLDRCKIYTAWTPVNIELYFDALDYSWSLGYSLGRNRLTEWNDLLGHYPATYSFPFEDIGAEPEGWVTINDVGSTTTIISSLSEHRKVLQLYDGSAVANEGAHIYQTFTAGGQTSGTIEFWWRTTDATKKMEILSDGMHLYTLTGNLYQYDAGGSTMVIAVANNQWYHIKLVFDCVPDTFDIYVDGVLELTGEDFENPIDSITKIEFRTEYFNTGDNWYVYYDAISYSWDPYYYTGKNKNPIVSNLPEQYPATYSFTNELVYEEPISFTNTNGAGSTSIIASYWQSHRKLLKCTSAGGGSQYRVNQQFPVQANGTIEFWMGTTDATNVHGVYLSIATSLATSNMVTALYTLNDVLYAVYGDGAGGTTTVNCGAIVDNQFAHIRIMFDTITDKMSIWRDGILYINNQNFDKDNRFSDSQIQYLILYGPDVADAVVYFDAIGYSWDDNNLIGDNLHYNNYLGSETFENYDQTYPGNYYGTESFNYYTEPEVYYGTYDFRDELGETGTDIELIDSLQADSYAEVNASYANHKAVVNMTATAASAIWHYIPANPTSGIIEFYWKGTVGTNSFRLRDEGGHILLYVVFYADGDVRVGYGDGLGGTIYTGDYVTTTAFPHFKIQFDCATDKASVWCEEVQLIDDENFATDHDAVYLDRTRWYFAGVSECYVDAYGESWDTTSHGGLGYTIGYNKLSSDIEPILEGGYEINNIHLGDSLEVVNILDSHMNVVNITGSSDFGVYADGWLVSPAQWGDFAFTKGAGNTVGELETDNDANYAIIDSSVTYSGESLLGIIQPADSDIIANWNEGDAAPHWSLLDEPPGGVPDGGNIRETSIATYDKWNFETLAITAGHVVTRMIFYAYCERQLAKDCYIKYTTSVGVTEYWTPNALDYGWEYDDENGLDISQAELTAFWMNVEVLYAINPGWCDIECIYIEVYESLKQYSVDYTMTWDVVDPNLFSIDFLRYDYRTTFAVDCDLDIYDYDDLDWDEEIESNTGVGFITGFYVLTDRYISGTNQVKIRFQSALVTTDFDMELDQIVLDYTNVSFSFDMRSLSIYDTFSQGSGTIEFWTYFADAPYISRVLFNNDTQIFHNGSYYWRYDTTDTEITPGAISEWVHFKVIWSGNDVDVYMNGTKFLDTFWSDGATTLTRLDFMSFDNYSLYVDAVGFSSDSDYDVGDNVNSHGKAVITALENEGWNIDTIPIEPYTSFGISGDYGSHKKFLNITDNSGYTYWFIDQDFAPIISGTVEFYYYVTTDQVIAFYLQDAGSSNAVRGYIRHGGNNFKVYDGAVLETIKTPDANNEWHHIRIVFDCSTDTFSIWIDGILEAENFDFHNGDLASITEISFSSTDSYSVDVSLYLDAFSYSWIIPQINYNTFLYGTNHTKTFAEQTSGTIEFWLDHDNYVNTSWIYLMSDFDYAYGIMINGSYLYFYDDEYGWNQSSYLAGNSFSHFRFDFDCSTDTVDFYHNGTLIANGVDFFKDLSSINGLIFILNQTGDFDIWLRALGYDWDADYDIDDNINPYGKEVITALENEGWTIVEDPFTSVGVSGEFNSHKKILNMTADAEGNNIDIYNSFGSSQAYGTYEFYIKMEIASDNVYLYGMRGATTTIQVRIYGDNLQAYYGASWNDIGVIFDDQWYHIRIDFECGSGGYEGLSADTYNVYLNGTRAGPEGIAFITVGDSLTQIRFYYTQAADRSVYIDSIGYSWKSIYDIGDNLHCNIEAVIDFIVEIPFEYYERFILHIIAESRHYTNILTNMTFSIYNFNSSTWVEISNSRSTSETLYSYTETDVINGLSKFFNGSGNVKFKYYGYNCSEFYLNIDLLNTTIYFGQTFRYEKTLLLLGTWKYRIKLDTGLGSEYNQTWVYFNVIPRESNFEGISESEYTTKWVLTSTATTGYTTTLYSDDLTEDSWFLTGFSSRIMGAVTGQADHDAYVWSQDPDVNYGSEIIMDTWSSGPPEFYYKEGYMQHSMTTSYQTENMSTSYLQFYSQNELSNDRWYFYTLTESFDEDTITWNNRPTIIKDNLGYSFFDGYGPFIDYINKPITDNIFKFGGSSGHQIIAYTKEAGSNEPYFYYVYNKNYHTTLGEGYAYMQTDIPETLGLKSSEYSQDYSLSEGDFFIVDLQTTSDNAQLKLYDDGVLQETLNILVANVNYERQEVEVSIDSDVTFDQVEITSGLTDTEYFKLYDIQGDYWTFESDEDQKTMYVEPFGKNGIIANLGNNTLKIYENDILQIDTYITITYDLTTYIYELPLPETIFVTFYDSDNDYLDFNKFDTYVNYTLNEETFTSQRLISREFYADEGSQIGFNVYDSFDVEIYNTSRLAKTLMDITLPVYELKIKNEALEYVGYDLSKNGSSIIKSGNIFSEEIIEFSIASGNYSLDYINYEDSYPRQYNFTLSDHKLISINTTYHTVYFGLFTYDGLGLNRDWVRFYINNVRKDFGRNIIQSETADLVVLDYFNNTLANETIDASAYSEYNIYVQVYSLYLLNQFTYDDLIMNITQVGSGTWMNQLIPPSSALLYRFIPNVNYTINATYINGTVYNIRTINLTDNSQTVSFGVPSKPEEYPKDVYFGIYTTTGLGIDHDLLRFYIDGNRTNFGFNTIRNMIVTLLVKDFFNTTLFNQMVNTSGIYEYDIMITLYSLKVKNEARVTTNYTLSYGLLETTGFILPEEIIQYQLSSNNYVFDYTNNEDGTSDTININLNQDRVYILNSTYYTTYFSLYDQNGVRLDDSLFSLYLNGSRKDFGFVELESVDVLIVVQDYLNFTAFNSAITLSGSTEYNIIITVFELQIRHLARENSNITLFETTTHNHINFSMSPDSLNKYILSDSTYNITWVNGENGISTVYDITLNTNYILTLNTSYYNIYFTLFDVNLHNINPYQYVFRLNGTVQDLGLIEYLQTDEYTITVADRFTTNLFNSIITLRGLNEYRIDVTLYELQVRHLARENSNMSLYETTTHNSLNFSMAPDTITSFILASSTYNITWTNGENGVATVYDITLNSDYILTLNTSYYDILFRLNDLNLHSFYLNQYEFRLNGTREVLGLIVDLQTDDYTIVIIDRFGSYLFNTVVTLRGLNEYMINISLYELQIRHLARENSDLILTEDVSGTTYSFIMTPDSIKSIIVGTADYTLSWTNGENGITTLISVALTTDRVIMLNTSYYDIFFTLYDVNLHIIDPYQYVFRLNGTIQDIGQIVDLQSDDYTITVVDRFGISLFNSIITLKGLNEYRIDITLYELQIRHLARENSNLTLTEDISGNDYLFVMTPDSIKSIVIGSADYTLGWTNGENGLTISISIALTTDRVIMLNTSYYNIYFSLFDVNLHTIDPNQYVFRLNGTIHDLGLIIDLQSDDYTITVVDRFGTSLFNSVVGLRGLNEYRIDITLYELQIRHLATENSNLSLYETITHNGLNFSMSPDTIKSFILGSSTYNVTWLNGENGISTVYNINLISDYILTLNTTYYDVYFGLIDQNGVRIESSLFSLYINTTRKDFGFVVLETDDVLINVQDYMNVTVFNQVVTLRNINEYDIIITVFEFQIRHLAYENSNITLYETTSHNCLNFSMAPDTINKFMLANSSYNVTWVNGENSVSTFYNITLNSNYILTLESSYFEVYFGLFTYDFLGVDRDFVKFYVNGDRKDFNEVLLEQDSNVLLVTDYFGYTLYSATMNLRPYSDGEWNIYVTIYTLNLFNNYTHPIDVEIERNGIEIMCTIPPQMSFVYRFVPDVKYDITWSYVNGTKIDYRRIKFEDNGQIVSFGFFETEVPYDPADLVVNTWTIVAFVIIICIICVVIVIAWAYMKKEKDVVPKSTRNLYKNKSQWKPGTFKDDGI